MSIAQADPVTSFGAMTASAWRLRIAESRSLLQLALPIAMIALVNMGMSVTDTLMVTWLFGADALAAVAVGSDLYSIVFYICAGILGGLSPFYTAAVTRADGADRVRLERIGCALVAFLAAICVPLVWFAPVWLEPVGLDPVLLERGEGFTRAMALTLIPMLGVVFYRTILTAAEKPKVFLKVTLAMLPLNAAGNYVLMQGWGPIPALGPTGAGISTLVVALSSLGALAVVARRATAGMAAPAGALSLIDWRGFGAVLRVGFPIGVAMTTETGIFLGATLYAARLGAADVAAHTLTLRMSGIAYAGSAALLQACMVRIARAEALGDSGRAHAIVSSSLAIALAGGVALCAGLLAGADVIAGAFFDAGAAGIAAEEVGVGLLVMLGVFEIFAYPGLAAAGVLRGRKDTHAPMVYTLVAYWAVGAPLGIYLCEVHRLGVSGLWVGLTTGAAIYSLLTLKRVLGSRR